MKKPTDRPTYFKWSRKTGGVKVCPECNHRHVSMMRINGRPQRVKACVKCGFDLPPKLKYPAKPKLKWYVREFDPSTGKEKDYGFDSAEQADEFIYQKTRDYTPDPTQRELIEYTAVMIRKIKADSWDDAVDHLIEKLGGDPGPRKLKAIDWGEARDIIADELKQKGLSETYIADLCRVLNDLRTITGVDQLQDVTLDAIAEYRRVRMAGGWGRDGRTIKAVAGRAINKDLGTLSAFLTRAAKKRWIVRNVLEGETDEKVKVKKVRVQYMPDADLRAIIEAADNPWMRAFVLVAYYTGARRSDILKLEWETDVDFDGAKVAAEGRTGPHVFIRGAKADTAHWTPLHSAAVRALKDLRKQPVIGPMVFAVKGFTRSPSEASRAFSKLCVDAEITKAVTRDGQAVSKNRWTLHDLRRKANTDLRNQGASPKERQALLGHRSAAVNEANYEALLPDRERQLIDSLPAFGETA
jgi:integrase